MATWRVELDDTVEVAALSDLKESEESFTGPNGDYYFHLMRRVHRTERDVIKDEIVQHATKGGYRVNLGAIEASEFKGGGRTEGLASLAVANLLSMEVDGDFVVSGGKKAFVCCAKKRYWHLSVDRDMRDKADAFILVWPIEGASASFDVIGWCNHSTFKRLGFSPKSAETPTWMIQWYNLTRMNTMGILMSYDDSPSELARRQFDSMEWAPWNMEKLIDGVMRTKGRK